MKKLLVSVLLFLSGCNHDGYLRNRVVKLTSATGSCSGTQVVAPSGTSYILTAAHCEGLAVDGAIDAWIDEARSIPRRILEISKKTDLMLLEGMPGLPGVKVSSISPLKGSMLTGFTHGLGLATYKSGPAELIQEKKVFIPISPVASDEDLAACESTPKFKVEETNFGFFKVRMCGLFINSYVVITSIFPGSSGGGIFNSSGQLVAVAFAGNQLGVAFLVTHPDIKAFLELY